ncbi:MAG: hypothetical protein ACKVT0_19825 [Planctomycetaceae bacterium]
MSCSSCRRIRGSVFNTHLSPWADAHGYMLARLSPLMATSKAGVEIAPSANPVLFGFSLLVYPPLPSAGARLQQRKAKTA